MRGSRIAGLFAVGAISLPFLTSSTSAVAASPRAAPAIGTQLAELVGSDTVAGDYFGLPVAISGTTAVVGAYAHDKIAVRAYVFTKTAAGWKQAAELEGSDTAAGDGFGSSVGLSSTTIVVGAQGHAKFTGRAYVFAKTATGWKQAAELEGSDTVAGDTFGYSVKTSGTTIVVGAPGHANSAGRAYVFTKTGAGWNRPPNWLAPTQLSTATTTASVSGWRSRARPSSWVQAPPAAGPGTVYVFTKTGAGWKQAARLEGSAYDFTDPLAISGTTIVVGAYDYANGRSSLCLHQDGGRLETSRRAGGLRHSRRR